MKKLVFSALLSVALFGCGSKQGGTATPSTTPEVSVDELATMIEANQVTVVDANSEETRKKLGIIPGATLLSSYENYDLNEIPADKSANLVYYCANTRCSASHKAAARASEAGYTNVKVLPAGVMGWKEAGREVQTVQ